MKTLVPINKSVSWHSVSVFKLVGPVYCYSCSILIHGVVSTVVGKIAAFTPSRAYTVSYMLIMDMYKYNFIFSNNTCIW